MEVSRSQFDVQPSHTTVLGSPIHLLKDYSQWLLDRVDRQGVHVVTLNAEMAMQAEQNSVLAEVIDRAELVIPDGAGVVLYLRLYGHKVQRCPGIELAESMLRQLPSEASVFFYGGAPGVTEQAAIEWRKRVPSLAIAGTAHGFLSAEEHAQLLDKLQTLQPSVILVGLGVPRQELWIAQHRSICSKAIWMGVGGSFDIWAGTKIRAPLWLRDNHLEWVYRLYQEPWRWRRMLALPHFAWKAIVSLRSLH